MEECVGMSVCQHVGTLEVYKWTTWMEECVGMLACWHVGTVEVYKCKTWVGEGVGMSARRNVCTSSKCHPVYKRVQKFYLYMLSSNVPRFAPVLILAALSCKFYNISASCLVKSCHIILTYSSLGHMKVT